MKTTHTRWCLATTAALALVLAGCGAESESQPGAGGGAEGFKVGVILPLTGPASAIGNDFNTALEVFREIDPEAQGLQIDYIVCDDRTTPDGAAACARKLVQQDRVNMIYGPVIGGSHAGARPVLASGPPSITPSPYATIEGGEPIFSASGNSADLDRATLQLARDRGLQRVAVLATTDLTGETAVGNLERANQDLGLQLAIERMGPTDVDATAQLNRLLQTDPQYFYVAASGSAAGVALKGLKQLGADLPTALIWSNTTNGFLQAAGPDFPSETLFAVAPSWDPDSLSDTARAEQIRTFQAAFEERSGAPVSFVVQGAYDAFQLIVRSLEEAGGDPDAITAYLEGLNDFQGLNWKLDYTPERHVPEPVGNYVMMRYDAASGQWSPEQQQG